MYRALVGAESISALVGAESISALVGAESISALVSNGADIESAPTLK